MSKREIHKTSTAEPRGHPFLTPYLINRKTPSRHRHSLLHRSRLPPTWPLLPFLQFPSYTSITHKEDQDSPFPYTIRHATPTKKNIHSHPSPTYTSTNTTTPSLQPRDTPLSSLRYHSTPAHILHKHSSRVQKKSHCEE